MIRLVLPVASWTVPLIQKSRRWQDSSRADPSLKRSEDGGFLAGPILSPHEDRVRDTSEYSYDRDRFRRF